MSQRSDRNALLFREKFLVQKEYWREKLGSTPLRGTRIVEAEASADSAPLGDVARYGWEFPESLARRAIDLGRGSDLSVYILLLTTLKVLIHRYTGDIDVVVASPVLASRRGPDTLNDRVFIRSAATGGLAFKDLILAVRQTLFDAYANQDYPHEDLLEALGDGRVARPHPSHVACSLDTLHREPVVDVGGDDGCGVTFAFSRAGGGLRGVLAHREGSIAPMAPARLASHFLSILDGMCRDPSARVSTAALLDPGEQAELTAQLRGVRRPLTPSVTIGDLIDEQASADPTATAIVHLDRQVSYAELVARRDRLASVLRRRGIGPGDVVATCVARTPELVIAILAIWEVGGVYLPLDASAPRLRLLEMLSDSGARAVIGRRRDDLESIAGWPGDAAIVLDEADGEAPGEPGDAPRRSARPCDLAYVIYTSGSTGKAKGATVEHLGMLNHLLAKIDTLDLTSRSRVAQVASQSFDISIWQLFAALAVGGRTIIYPDEVVRRTRGFVDRLGLDGVTILEVVPSYLAALLDAWEDRREGREALRWLIVTGEAVHRPQLERWFGRFPGVPVVNAYGPTEAGDDITHHVMTAAPLADGVPIGKAIQNMNVYVVDSYGQLCPRGVKGEIWVAGVGVGRGYLNDPGRTGDAFLDSDVFDPTNPGRLFKTGDVGRVADGGTIEFFGRRDSQVKINGHRIELGEIEARLMQLEGIAGAAVVACAEEGGGRHQLVAFVTGPGAIRSREEIRRGLSATLPKSMIPSRILAREALPLTPNGKVDRAALARDATGGPSRDPDERSAPSNPAERRLAEIWKDVLALDEIGVDESFFELGGHSVSAIQIASRIAKYMDGEVSIAEFFSHPTIREQAGLILSRGARARGRAAIPPRLARPDYALSPIQFPEWYLAKLNPGSTFYNIGVQLEFRGRLDVDAFLASLQRLIARHDVLRTSFIERDGEPRQVLHDAVPFGIDDLLIDVSGGPAPEDDAVARIEGLCNRPVDFGRAPPATMKLVRVGEIKHIFVFETHHIIWDQDSTFAFADELKACYNALARGEAPDLPPLRVNYVDYCEWSNERIRSGELERQRRYWLDLFETPPAPLDLPTDFPRPPLQTFDGDVIYHHVDPETRARLEEVCRDDRSTFQIFLLSVLAVQLRRLTGQHDFVVGTPITNRTREELEGLLGLFAAAMPIRCRIPDDCTFQELVERNKQISLEAYDNSAYPLCKVIEALDASLDFSRSRLISVFFGVQNENTPFDDLAGQFHGLRVGFFSDERVREASAGTSVFDFTLQVDHSDKYMYFSLRYNTDLFRPETARRMLDQYAHLFRQCLDAPRGRLSEFRLAGAEGGAADAGGGAPDPAPIGAEDGPIHRRIERIAELYPDRTAVVYRDGQTTYGALDRGANRLARHLRASGVRPGDRVGILLPRSLDMIVAIVAVMKAGAAFVPLGRDWPPSRIRHIVATTGMRRLIADGWWTSTESACEFGDLLLDLGASVDEIDRLADGALPEALGRDAVAYVMFTSGSTGLPKGVEIPERGLSNIIDSTERACGLGPDGVVLFNTELIFDSSLLDIVWPLAVGARIVVMEDERGRDVAAIARAMNEHRVTLCQAVPLLLGSLVDARECGDIPPVPSLAVMNCGGAILTGALRARFDRWFGCRLFNNYGPTEASIDVARHDGSGDPSREIVPIGRAIERTALYVLDDCFARCPVGVPGELYIASIGTAFGYVQDPGRTASAFVPNPFADGFSTTLYRTGDRAVCLEDGNLIVTGRADSQVEVNGCRVELEEIEAAILADPFVANAAVLCEQGPRGDRLIAFVELREALNRVSIAGGGTYRFYTLSQYAPCDAEIAKILRDGLREDDGPPLTSDERATVCRDHPELQILLVGGDDRIAAIAFSAPSGDRRGACTPTAGRRARDDDGADSLVVLERFSSTSGDVDAAGRSEALAIGLRTVGRHFGYGHVIDRGRSHTAARNGVLPHATDTPPKDSIPGMHWVHVDHPYVRGLLRRKLPAYMLPHAHFVLNRIPRLGSGKTDRRTLASRPSGSAIPPSPAAPLSRTQEVLVACFREILGRPQIGIHDHFFRCGGHSLNVLQLLARVEVTLGSKLSVRELIANPTVDELSRIVDRDLAVTSFGRRDGPLSPSESDRLPAPGAAVSTKS